MAEHQQPRFIDKKYACATQCRQGLYLSKRTLWASWFRIGFFKSAGGERGRRKTCDERCPRLVLLISSPALLLSRFTSAPSLRSRTGTGCWRTDKKSNKLDVQFIERSPVMQCENVLFAIYALVCFSQYWADKHQKNHHCMFLFNTLIVLRAFSVPSANLSRHCCVFALCGISSK